MIPCARSIDCCNRKFNYIPAAWNMNKDTICAQHCHFKCSTQAFILAVLRLLFNPRLWSRDKATNAFLKLVSVTMIRVALEEFVFLEHYAGKAVMSHEIGSMYNEKTAALDIQLRRGMNILSAAGFAFEA